MARRAKQFQIVNGEFKIVNWLGAGKSCRLGAKPHGIQTAGN
jgi:hypothetical protein